ncbi:unnamed protein product, partial [marine sediment metagenome]
CKPYAYFHFKPNKLYPAGCSVYFSGFYGPGYNGEVLKD